MEFKTLTSTLVLSFLLAGSQAIAMDCEEPNTTNPPVTQKTDGGPDPIEVNERRMHAVGTETVNLQDWLTASSLNVNLVGVMAAALEEGATEASKAAGTEAAKLLKQNALTRKQQKEEEAKLASLTEEEEKTATWFWSWFVKVTPLQEGETPKVTITIDTSPEKDPAPTPPVAQEAEKSAEVVGPAPAPVAVQAEEELGEALGSTPVIPPQIEQHPEETTGSYVSGWLTWLWGGGNTLADSGMTLNVGSETINVDTGSVASTLPVEDKKIEGGVPPKPEEQEQK